MTPGQHPDLEELMLYCMEPQNAESGSVSHPQLGQHLAQCADCRAEIARLRTDLALLAMAVPQVAPPARARERLLRAVASEAAPASPVQSSQPAKVVPIGKPRRSSLGLAWGGWIAAAACLLYAVQLRESNRGMSQELQTETAQLMQINASAARAKEVMDVLSSPQAQRVTLVAAHARPEPTGQAVYLKDRGALVFTASNLAPLPTNKTYELWVIPANGAAPIPAGTFQPDARGIASVLLPKLPQGVQAKAFGVTMENAGGSSTPTLPILLAGG
jgi:anti-sigma-K factor RskA